jgi:hypothetical protein
MEQQPPELLSFIRAHHAQNPLADSESLEIRQNAAVGGGGVAPPQIIPTQMPTVTVYDPRNGKPMVTYTQLFSAVPVQWDAPKQGVMGLGTLTGSVGAVRTATP